MILRTYDTSDLETLLLEDTVGFDRNSFKKGSKNVILTDGKNYTVYEYVGDGEYFGHVFFRDRGKEALRICKDMIEIFFSDYPAYCIKGLTPVDMPEAVWFSKKLGFKSYGVITTEAGEAVFSILYKKDFING